MCQENVFQTSSQQNLSLDLLRNLMVFLRRIENTYVPWSKVAILGMVIPPLIGNTYNGYINPYYWGDEFIPYYMEIIGV